MSLVNLIEAFKDRAGRLTLRDFKRLQQAYSVASKRGRIPTLDVVGAEMRNKIGQAVAAFADGEDPLGVFEDSVQQALTLTRSILEEAHGEEYAEDLWKRIWS